MSFRAADRVRLVREHDGRDPGSEGVIVGFFRADEERCLVEFGDGGECQVPSDHLERIEARED